MRMESGRVLGFGLRFLWCGGCLLLVLILARGAAQGQVEERLQPGPTHSMPHRSMPKLRASIELPFFDDFAYGGMPTPSMWEHPTGAVASFALAIRPPTVGALIFDACDADGKLYPERGEAFLADEITSRPINLGAEGDSIYLSFYIQPAGYGDSPSPKDSLLLEFFSESEDSWFPMANFTYRDRQVVASYTGVKIWPSLEQSDQKQFLVSEQPTECFFRVHIPIRDPKFMGSAFRFRFRNRATVPNLPEPSRAANGSIWCVDRVYMNAGRGMLNPSEPDVGMIRPISAPFLRFKSVPAEVYGDFIELREKGFYDSLRMSYRNFSSEPQIVGMNFHLQWYKPEVGDTLLQPGIYQVNPYEDTICSWSYRFNYGRFTGTEILLRYVAEIDCDENEVFHPNNRVFRDVHFTDEYSYDNEEASIGYGVVGVGSEKAQVALRFDPLGSTVVRAVKLWFMPTASPERRANFKICLWDERDGLPGRCIAMQTVEPPRKAEELGRFHQFDLEQPLLLDGPFYVGWQQEVADMMNVGFDMSSTLRPGLFYRGSKTGQWRGSKFAGVLMLRVVTGGEGEAPPPEEEEETAVSGVAPRITLRPNPCADYLTISAGGAAGWAEVYSLEGRCVLRMPRLDVPQDVSTLPPGLYLVQPYSVDGRRLPPVKLMKR